MTSMRSRSALGTVSSTLAVVMKKTRDKSMAPDLGFIAHAAERDTDEFAAHGSRDRPTEGSFSYTWRSHEAQDRRFTLRPQLENGQVFEDSLLNFFQIIVIAIEDFPGFDNIDFLRCQNTPRQRDR